MYLKSTLNVGKIQREFGVLIIEYDDPLNMKTIVHHLSEI